MRVENKNDRWKMPEECDYCGYFASLKRFYHYGPGHQVDWACPYCSLDYTQGKDIVVKSIASMLNELEKRLKTWLTKNLSKRNQWEE
uniref:Uncharacterized protein n=1 Tax=viral metagenome TaxID=1070528 RepID=A0A6H1ZPQ5_9ZZZZ